MKQKKSKAVYESKTMVATPEFWKRVDDAQQKAGIQSRSNFIRIAVDKYLDSLQHTNGAS